jgi:hypothetical protein
MRKLLLVTGTLSLLCVVFAPDAWAGDFVWDHVGNGGTPGTAPLNGTVTALLADGTDLYVGGAFTDAGGVTSADYVAKWNGTAWSGFAPLNGSVYAIAYAGGKLIVGGAFTDASGNANADFLAAWNGSAWEPFCTATGPGPAFNGNVFALQVIGNKLYIGGGFQDGAGIAAADYLVACDLTTGAANSTADSISHSLNGTVYALTADDGGTLYAGGAFINVAGILAADHVAAYDGAWHAMGSGPGAGGAAVDSIVRALASDGTNVYVGTDAVDIAGIGAADHVVRWNGNAWSAMGASYFPDPAVINALVVDGSFVFAGGNFQDANGDPLADTIAYWDGSAWHPLGSNGAGNGPLAGNANALATLGARVFAGGGFASAGGDTLAQFIAQSPIAPIYVFADGFEF